MASATTVSAPVVMSTSTQQWNGIVSNQMSQGHISYLKLMISLGIAEVIIGGICILLGIFDPTSFLREGIWCGCFIVVAGGLGIGAGKNSTICLIKTHMAFSIIGTVFALFLTLWPPVNAELTHSSLYPLPTLSALLGWTATILEIVSAVLCCLINRNVCTVCFKDTSLNTQQFPMQYVTTSGHVQGIGNQTVVPQPVAYPANTDLQHQQPINVGQQPQYQPQHQQQLHHQPQQQLQQQHQQQLQSQLQQQLQQQQQQQQQAPMNKIDLEQLDANQANNPPTYDNATFNEDGFSGKQTESSSTSNQA